MKKSLRKPNRRVLGVVPSNGLKNIQHGLTVVENSNSALLNTKVEGNEMLSKVKKYEPVVIKGYKYAF